jgi:hypothetical protein
MIKAKPLKKISGPPFNNMVYFVEENFFREIPNHFRQI